MPRHRRHRLEVEVDHDGRITVNNCDLCTDAVEAIRILDAVQVHLQPLAEVHRKFRRIPGPAPVEQPLR